jgi:pyrroline-5-carboxylate reductase
MPRISFLGSGNMASAIAAGVIAKKVAPVADLACLGGNDPTGAALSARTGIRLAKDVVDLCSGADAVVVAFKPQNLADADPRLAEATRGKLVISILAGKKLSSLSKKFPHARAIVRAMPNLPGSIGAGIVGWSSLAPLSESDSAIAFGVLGALGAVHSFPEEMLDSVTALGGSGPGFVFEFAAALREAGVAAGFTRELAAEFATEVLLGSAKLLKQSGEDADVLRDRVTSPKGTTYAGLEAMKSAKFRDIMRATILAARDRSRELSKDS